MVKSYFVQWLLFEVRTKTAKVQINNDFMNNIHERLSDVNNSVMWKTLS